MDVSYDVFAEAFLEKISEYEFLKLSEQVRTDVVDGYMRRAMSDFKKNCKLEIASSYDSENRVVAVNVKQDDLDEIVEIVSEGMILQWLKPYMFHQENLENAITTRDYTVYSPANLLKQIAAVYSQTQKGYIQMIREYSYNHGDLTDLHI